MSISEEKIPSVVEKLHPYKVVGSDGIPFLGVTQRIQPPFAFTTFDATVNQAAHPEHLDFPAFPLLYIHPSTTNTTIITSNQLILPV
jgi:hypothetical protein